MDQTDSPKVQMLLDRSQRHSAMGRPADAIASYAEVLRHPHTSPRQAAIAAHNRALILSYLLDRIGAIDDCSLIIDQPDVPPALLCLAWLNRGVYRFLLTDHAGAICDFTACMNITPTLHARLEMAQECGFRLADGITPARLRAHAGWMRAYARWYLTDYAGASSDCRVVMHTDGIKPIHTAGAHAILGLVNLVNSNFTDAASELRQALRLGSHPCWQAMLGVALLGQDDVQAGMSEFARAMTASNTAVEALDEITAFLDRIALTARPINGLPAIRKILSDRAQHLLAIHPDPHARRFRRLRNRG